PGIWLLLAANACSCADDMPPRSGRTPSREGKMSYFVTGATGFIGRHLVANLLKRKGTIHVLVRRGSQKKLDALIERMGWDRKRIVPVVGDLAKPRLGLNAEKTDELKGKVKHFFHLAAIYDLAADAQSQMQANVEGTRNAIALAEAVNAGC